MFLQVDAKTMAWLRFYSFKNPILYKYGTGAQEDANDKICLKLGTLKIMLLPLDTDMVYDTDKFIL